MYAKNERDKLNDLFRMFELGIHFLVVVIYSCAFILAIPFVRLYTLNVQDADYCLPMFAYVFLAASMFFCLRTPYYTVVQSVGHFKETQNSAIIEAVLNVVLSLVFVFKLGLLGVAIGTCVAMAYRTLYLVVYLSKNILGLSLVKFVIRMMVDFVAVSLSIFLCDSVVFYCNDYVAFAILGFKVFGISLLSVFIVNIAFYCKDFRMMLRLLKKRGSI
jgi:Na+-driven multidrug efflux pump